MYKKMGRKIRSLLFGRLQYAFRMVKESQNKNPIGEVVNVVD